MAVVAHADDEVLGVGGTLARHVRCGDEVHVTIAADCRTVRDPTRKPALNPIAVAVAKLVGYHQPVFLGYRAMTLDQMNELERNIAVTHAINAVNPDIVYTHHAGDINTDHRAVARAVAVACRPVGGHPRRVLAFETPSSTEWGGLPPFVPNVFMDIGDVLDAKLEAMVLYNVEVREHPHPRSLDMLRARAAYWGQTAGLAYAEPFMLLREVL